MYIFLLYMFWLSKQLHPFNKWFILVNLLGYKIKLEKGLPLLSRSSINLLNPQSSIYTELKNLNKKESLIKNRASFFNHSCSSFCFRVSFDGDRPRSTVLAVPAASTASKTRRNIINGWTKLADFLIQYLSSLLISTHQTKTISPYVVQLFIWPPKIMRI